MTRIDTYKHLDEDSSVKVELSMEEIARKCVALNYGAHRLLSALVHELRRTNAIRAERWAVQYPKDGPYDESQLAQGIEDLLNKGLYC